MLVKMGDHRGRNGLAILKAGPLVAVLSLSVFAAPATAKPLDVFKDCPECPEMIELPLGEFLMGAPPDEAGLAWHAVNGDPQLITTERPYLKDDEGPQQLVTVDIGFAIGRNEVTYAEWMDCVQDGGCNSYIPRDWVFRDGPFDGEKVEVKDSHPVLNISFADAQAYIDWLNGKTGGNNYRLPTEAEWEYAARADTTSRFAQGDILTSGQAAFSKQATEFVLLKDLPDLVERGYPVPVDELAAANAWGLRHMSGNASEVTISCYTPRLPILPFTSLWLAVASNDCAEKVVRGGDYTSPIVNLRPAWRIGHNPAFRAESGGFRIIKELD